MSDETTAPGEAVYPTAADLAERMNLTAAKLEELVQLGLLRRGWVFPPDYPRSHGPELRVVYLDQVPDYLAELLRRDPAACRRRSFRNLRLISVQLPPSWRALLRDPPGFLFDTGMHFSVPAGATGVPQPVCMVFHDGAGREFVLVGTQPGGEDLEESARLIDLPLASAVFLQSERWRMFDREFSTTPPTTARQRATLTEQRHRWLVDQLRAAGVEVPPPVSRGGRPGIKAELLAKALRERPDLFTKSAFNRAWTALRQIN